MNTNTDRDTTRVTGTLWARRAATLSVAGVLAGLALAPTAALADHPSSGGGGTPPASGDKWSYMYDVATRKEAMARVQDTNDAQASSQARETVPPTSTRGATCTTPTRAASRWFATGSRPRRCATTPSSGRRTPPWPPSWSR